MASLPERLIASASTSDHHPMPMQATFIACPQENESESDMAASCAKRSSNSQLPPATPTPPMHSPPAMIGAPPSIAVQRSGPAARARPSAWATSSVWPTAPLDPVLRLLDAAHTALVVA